MNREKEFLRNTGILAFGTVVPKAVNLLILPIYTAYLTREEYGIYDLIMVLAILFIPLATMQIQSSAFRFLIENDTDYDKRKSIITNTFVFLLPSVLVALMILYIFLYRIENAIRFGICVYFLMDVFMNVGGQIARGSRKNHIYSIGAIINAGANLLFSIFFLIILKRGLIGLIWSLCAACTLSVIAYFSNLKIWKDIDLSLVDKKLLKDMLNYSIAMIPNQLSHWVMNVSDRLLVTGFLGVSANGIYAVANKIPNMFSLVQSTFSMGWQESAALSVKDKDVELYYTQMFEKVFGIFFGIMSFMISITPITFKILIRGNYDEAYFQIPILYLGCFFSALCLYLGGIYVAHKKTKVQGLTTTAAAISNFMINFLFIKKIGLYAASLSTLISYVALFVFRLMHVRRFQKIRFNYCSIGLAVCWLTLLSFLTSRRCWWIDIINICLAFLGAVLYNKNIICMALTFIKDMFHKRRSR